MPVVVDVEGDSAVTVESTEVCHHAIVIAEGVPIPEVRAKFASDLIVIVDGSGVTSYIRADIEVVEHSGVVQARACDIAFVAMPHADHKASGVEAVGIELSPEIAD